MILRPMSITCGLFLTLWNGMNAEPTIMAKDLVDNVHKIPRIGYDFQSMPADFTLSANTLYPEDPYVQSLITFPAILLGIGIISFVVFLTIMITRIFLPCGACTPRETDQYEKYEGDYRWWAGVIVCRRGILNAVYWLGWIFAIVGAHLLFLGNSMYDPSLDSLRNDLSLVRSKFQLVKTTAQSYMNIVSTSYVAMDTSTCRVTNASQVFPVLRNLIEINAGSQALYEASYPMPMRLDQMDNVLTTYAIVAKNAAVYTCYSFVTLVCILSMVSVATKNKVLTMAMAWLQGITSAAVMLVRSGSMGGYWACMGFRGILSVDCILWTVCCPLCCALHAVDCRL